MKCRASKPQEKSYKLSDAHGLYLFVAPTGLRSWRWKYRIAGREKVLTIGSYPEVTLAEARSKRDAAARELCDGFDPSRVKKQQAATTFEVLARAWHKQNTRSWSVGHARNVLSSMVDEAFPKIGHLPITKIQPAHILEVLRPMEQRGAVDQAHRLRQRMSDVFVLAISSGLAETNPAAIVRKALQPIIKRNYPALTSIEEARALLEADAHLKGWPITKLASRLLAITAARSEALRHAEPHEFEGLDGLSPLWRVPAAKMKLGVERRKQAALEFIIPLPRQAVEIVKLAKQLTAPGPYLIPNVRLPLVAAALSVFSGVEALPGNNPNAAAICGIAGGSECVQRMGNQLFEPRPR